MLLAVPSYVNDSPAITFLDRGKRLLRLQGRVLQQVMADTVAEKRDVNSTVITPETNVKEFADATLSRLTRSRERWEDLGLMFQLFFCRHVDNFQIFLEELLSIAVRKDPALVEGIKLRKADMGLHADEKLARRLRKLAFMSIRELQEVLADQMRFDLFGDKDTARAVEQSFDIRNLITHSYGVVDKHFLSRHPIAQVQEGQTIPLTPEFIHAAVQVLGKAGADVQARAQKRFGLKFTTVVNLP